MAALAYSVVIVYASLQPFSGWRGTGLFPGAFLAAPWPRWITVEDIGFNFVAYLPLGFLLVIALRALLAAPLAVICSAMLCALLSLSLETAQQYLPARFASNLDLLVNTIGAATGALIAPLFAPDRPLGEPLARTRNRFFIEGPRGDAVLLLAGLWLITQLYAAPLILGNGDLRETLALAAGPLRYTPETYRHAEAAVVMLNIVGAVMLLSCAAHAIDATFWRAASLLLLAALVLKTAAAAFILRAASPWQWLTPGLLTGFAAAVMLTLVLSRLPPRGRVVAALLSTLAALALVNSLPENPYRAAPLHLLPGRAGHLLSFSNMARALSELWPLLATAMLLTLLPGRTPPGQR
jgi:VanZ family protein